MTDADQVQQSPGRWPLNRAVGLCLDALMCIKAPYSEPLRELWTRGGLHSRFETLFRLLDRQAPAALGRLSRAVLRNVNIDGTRFKAEPVNRGRAVTVFRLTQSASSVPLALKVYRSSIGLQGKRLAKLESSIQQGINELERWYGGAAGILVTTRLVRINSPVLQIPALALVQPLVSVAIKDFFRDYDDSQLLDLLNNDKVLAEQFVVFASGTRTALQEGTRCFDMHGENNLGLLSTPDGYRLCIVDYGVYDLSEREVNAPSAYREILQLHERLFALRNKLIAQR